jgi:hypothetical protein
MRPDYEYLLPIFVGHPFDAPNTETLRVAISGACEAANAKQSTSEKRLLWVPRFLNRLDSGAPSSVLETIREAIRQSAVTLFDITDRGNVNVFLELGISLGMGRAMVLTCHKPFNPPADLRGLRGIEYTNGDDLQLQLVEFLDARLRELRETPPPGQDVLHHKIQIDAIWDDLARTAKKKLYYFAGDVSWVRTLGPILQEAVGEGVGVHVCCQMPDRDDVIKWQNIDRLRDLGAKVRAYPAGLDPRLRGFLTEPQDLSEQTLALLVEKETRVGGRADYARTGVTVGESEFFYKANLFRCTTHPRITCALVRLFEATWKDSLACERET